MVEPDLLNAITELERAHSHIPDSNLVKLANKSFEYINNPNNEATQLRSYAFHFYLGTNLSSAMVNLTQTVQSTYPILASVIGTGKGGVEVLRAGKDAMTLWKYMHTGSRKAPRLGKYGFEFFKSVVDENGNVRHEIKNDLPLGRNIDEMLRTIDALAFHELLDVAEIDHADMHV